ncbi:TPA: DUF4935 domain-containing protein [Burkholderia cepacia]|uniref:PIN domain-containing protein n=1 Tax=Burkholderia cepacia TaxID=292 RepID=UPI0011B26111|nr:PIN domain-containing protein [Burkholderia cepacia]HDR9511801.1 DUF4935 domain-containing protein [Burkholderia cepacia]
MKQVFPGHYRPTHQEIDRMWAEGTFVFDANALLNLYRYTDGTRETFIQTLEALASRVWIPYQVGLEFFQNRIQVMSTAISGYSKLRNELEKARAELGTILNGFRRHPGINVEEISKALDETFWGLKADLEKQENEHPDWITGQDPVLERLTGVFEGRIGEKPEAAAYDSLIAKAKARFESSTPPGLRDKEKGGIQQYGDAILWLEVLEKAATTKTAIIFVTDDVKDDWWQRVGGKTIGPLPALRQELHDVANVPLHMYQCDQFMRYASAFLDQQLPESSIEEAKEIRDELQRESNFEQQWLFDESASSHARPDNDAVPTAWSRLHALIDSHEGRPILVDDYRGSTLEQQLSNLAEQRQKLRRMMLDASVDPHRVEEIIEIQRALDFVEREIGRMQAWMEPVTLRNWYSHVRDSKRSDQH